MLSKIMINNFQSHEKSELIFTPGVNVITGSSDSGKSAILRAIQWLCTNRPLGNSFIQWGSKKCMVEFQTNDLLVGRSKTKSENFYHFNGADLLAGTEVPMEIKNKLKIIPSINFQAQIGKPFLLADSPGEVAQFFNDVAGLDDIDLSLRNLKSWLNHSIKSIGHLEFSIKTKSEQLKELEFLDEFEISLSGIEEKQKEEEKKRSRYEAIKNNTHKWCRLTEAIKPVKTKSEALVSVTEQSKKLSHLIELKKRRDRIMDLVLAQTKHAQAYEEISKLAQGVKDIDIAHAKFAKYEKVQNRKIKLAHLVLSWKRANVDYKQAVNKKTDALKLFNDKMPEHCPLCGALTNTAS